MTTLRTSLTRLAFVFALLLLTAGCKSAPTVISDTAPGAKLDAYRTFGFMEKSGTDAAAYTTLTTQHLREAATREMVARGYQLASAPDLLVDFVLGFYAEQKKSGGGVSVGAGKAGGSGAAGVGVNLGNLFGGKGVESTVRIDVVDRQQKQVVWNGSVTQRVPADQAEPTKEMIDQAVATVFTKYPKPVGAAMQ